MKFDMHCHTKEGSIDAKVGLEDYVKKLIRLGYDGMLVTDHNSYKGYDRWQEIRRRIEKKTGKSFVVLKGIEYDTRDAGHMLVILPEKIHSRILEIRGMRVRQLEKIVHEMGGILGPAHPYGTGFFAFKRTRTGKLNERLMHKFDFVESFNSCSKPLQNMLSRKLALKYKKAEFGGSDAHRERVIGSAYTLIDREIRNNDDLIAAIREKVHIFADGDWEDKVRKKQRKIVEQSAVAGYWIYNQLLAGINVLRRRNALKKYRELRGA